jgi:hypothetical protein
MLYLILNNSKKYMSSLPWRSKVAGKFQEREVRMLLKNTCKMDWVPVAHTHNPSYSGSRDPEDLGSKPA